MYICTMHGRDNSNGLKACAKMNNEYVAVSFPSSCLGGAGSLDLSRQRKLFPTASLPR